MGTLMISDWRSSLPDSELTISDFGNPSLVNASEGSTSSRWSVSWSFTVVPLNGFELKNCRPQSWSPPQTRQSNQCPAFGKGPRLGDPLSEQSERPISVHRSLVCAFPWVRTVIKTVAENVAGTRLDGLVWGYCGGPRTSSFQSLTTWSEPIQNA